MSDLLSAALLQQLEVLESGFHANLGKDLLEKIRDALPEIRNDKLFADRGILWWILHNQLEVIGRAEACKTLLSEIVGLPTKSTSEIKGKLAALSVTLDHLKQNLTFLVGEIQVTSEGMRCSFYELDAGLHTYAMSGDEALKHYQVLIEPTVLKFESTQLLQNLEQFGQTLHQHLEKGLANKTVEAVKEMLVAADYYYAEVAAFSDSEARAMLLFYHFRRVEAAGMRLLSAVIIAETMISTVYYIM